MSRPLNRPEAQAAAIQAAADWRPIPGYEGLYVISRDGRVRSLDRAVFNPRWGSAYPVAGREMKPHVSDLGYRRVTLSSGGAKRFGFVHHLVLEAFVGPRPDGMLACHNDGDPSNNHIDNLRWDTPAGNMRDCLNHGTHWQLRKTHCRNGHAYNEANTRLRPDGSRLCRICHRESERRRRTA